jgi:hypothetical protein
VASTPLLGLMDCPNACRFDFGTNCIRLVSDDDKYTFRGCDPKGRVDRVPNQRLSPSAVKNFGHAALHAGTFAGRENYDCNIFEHRN